jgi:hypothetical protein
LYSLNPRLPGKHHNVYTDLFKSTLRCFREGDRAKSVAVVARALLSASDEVVSIIPVSLILSKPEKRTQRSGRGRLPTHKDSCHLALCMQLRNGQYIMLPLIMWLMGGQPKPTQHHSGWESISDTAREILSKFQDNMALQVSDVQVRPLAEEVQLVSQSTRCWTPRRYETVWHLAPNLGTAGEVITSRLRMIMLLDGTDYSDHHRDTLRF